MSWAVRYTHGGVARESRFAHRNARLPLSARSGAQVILHLWGRRPCEAGNLPYGGWARLTQIQADVWSRFRPVPVRLPINAFAERDVMGHEHWFEVTRGQYLQGCLARIGNERRVYVVTLDCAPTETEFERWPRIVSSV